MNLLGLVPLMSSPTSNLNITVALAICVFVLVQYLNIRNMGLKGFLYHLAGSPTNAVGWLIVPLMFPIELLTQLSRPVTLALRLFGNILGEKILVAFFAMVGITLLYFFPIQIPFMFLGILTSVMQAMVFTLLTAIYILLSVPHTEEIH
jgi:F-type H+-transporting ATPase subunit a